MENRIKGEDSEVFSDVSSCPEEDRSWKRRQKEDAPDKNKAKDDNSSSRNSSTERRPVRERLGKLDSQGNHFIQSKPRYHKDHFVIIL